MPAGAVGTCGDQRCADGHRDEHRGQDDCDHCAQRNVAHANPSGKQQIEAAGVLFAAGDAGGRK